MPRPTDKRYKALKFPMKKFISFAIVISVLCLSRNTSQAANDQWCINKRIGVDVTAENKSFRCIRNVRGRTTSTESTQYTTDSAAVRWGVVTIGAVPAPIPGTCSIIPLKIHVQNTQPGYTDRGLSIYALDFAKRKLGQIDVVPRGVPMKVGLSNFEFKVCGSSWTNQGTDGKISAFNSALYCGMRFYFAPEIFPANQSSMQFFFAKC